MICEDSGPSRLGAHILSALSLPFPNLLYQALFGRLLLSSIFFLFLSSHTLGPVFSSVYLFSPWSWKRKEGGKVLALRRAGKMQLERTGLGEMGEAPKSEPLQHRDPLHGPRPLVQDLSGDI